MKRLSKTLMLCCLALAVFCSGVLMACGGKNPPAPPAPVDTTLVLNRTTAELDLYEEVRLSVTETGDGAVAWSSSDNAVATVKDGLVKSVAAGVAVIKAERGEKSGYCTVTVVNSFTAPIISFGETEFVADKGSETHVTASVRYKGEPVDYAGEIEWDLTEIYNFESNAAAVATLALDDDKKGATVAVGAYGEAMLTASAVVWGIPVSGAVNVRAINQSVEITSALERTGENYAVTLNPIDVTYKSEHVSKNSVDPQITVKENGAEVDDATLTWLVPLKNVAVHKTDTDMITAVENGDLGVDTLVGVYKGNCVKIDVSVELAEIEFTDADKWIMELKDIPAQDGTFSVTLDDLNTSLTDGNIAGDIEKVEIPYKRIDANNVITNTKTDILQSFDSDTKTATLTPPVHAYNMGDMTATVATTKAIYTVPMGIYTLVISDADELDEFARYTTYQWDDPYLWDGYFVLDKDITYNENLQSVMAGTRAFAPFIWAKKRKQHTNDKGDTWWERYFDAECTVNVNNWNTGFIGMFDGNGYNIEGFVVDASEDERTKNDENNQLEWGGFIGKLGAVSFGDTLRRGTIKNVSFTNAIHGGTWPNGTLKGTWGGFLYSMSLGGAVENVYIESRMVGSNGFFGGTDWLVQSSTMKNVVLNITVEENWNADYAVGTVHNYSGSEFVQFRNVYTVRAETDKYSLNSAGDIKNSDSVPYNAFESTQALGDYLAEKNLTVSAENGWDMDFWTVDENGAPVPLALTKIALDTHSVTLDMHEKVQLIVKTTVEGTVTWKSSDTGVATVDDNGLVRSVADGTAVITAEIEGYTARCTVTVQNTNTPPVITVDTPNVQISERNGTATVTASVTYKGNAVDENVAYTWTKTSDNTNNQITLVGSGATVTITGGEYGGATFKVETTVWGQTISATVNVFVANPDITLTSDLPTKAGSDVHTLTLEMFTNGVASTGSAGITLKNGANNVALSNLVWRTDSDDEGIVTLNAEMGEFTAVGGGAVTFIASYQGASLTIEVTVIKEEKMLESRWTVELLDKTDDVQVTVSDISSDIKGVVQKVEIEDYNYYNGETYERTGTKDILKSENNGVITLSPPYRYREGMGDTTVTITTTQGAYTMPMSIYTFVISDETDLNKFGEYTTQQWARTDVSNYFWDGYFVLDSDITCSSANGFQSFINAHLQDDQWLKYTVNGTEVDASKVGFRGMFDGRGHVIGGMKIGNTLQVRGGLVGILNGVAGGRPEERGTIQNISFTNVTHQGEHWSGFLYSVSTYGVVRNIYIQANTFAANSFMGYGEYATQNTDMQNVVIDAGGIANWCNWYNMFGWLYYSGDMQNLYAVATPEYNKNGNGAINVKDGVTLNDSTPADAFANRQALGDYLADKNLVVSAANGWNMEFWTTDKFGAPIPKKLAEQGETIESITLSTVNVQTFDGFMPRVYAWNVASDSVVAFASSDESVATVTKEGLIVAKGNGTTTVTATAGVGTVGTLSVTVTDAYAGAKGFYGYTAIASVADIERLAALDGATDKYILARDIDLNGRVGSIAHDFKGTFDGNGFALKNGKLQIGDDRKTQSLFSGRPGKNASLVIRNLKIIGLETEQAENKSGTDWAYVGVLDDSNSCTMENVYVQLIVNADGRVGGGNVGDATFGRPGYGTFKNIIVDVTYTGAYYNYASLFVGAWGNGNTVEDVYAIVHTQGDVDFSKIKDTFNNQGSGLSESADRNYESLQDLKDDPAHAAAFAEGGAFTGSFWDGVLQMPQK